MGEKLNTPAREVLSKPNTMWYQVEGRSFSMDMRPGDKMMIENKTRIITRIEYTANAVTLHLRELPPPSEVL